MSKQQEFIDIFHGHIKREGNEKLLEYINSTDFFVAPASTRFHCSYKGGLVEHSINVYHCLKDYLSRNFVKVNYGLSINDDGIALIALLHDICKINTYKASTRNVKDEMGVWKPVPYYEYEDTLPYGHGEKSVYIINGFVKLSREEAFAIRYHMGFSGCEDKFAVGRALEQFPLAIALSVADMEATFVLESKNKIK